MLDAADLSELARAEAPQPASPYDLKRAVALGVGQFWSLPHTQLYSECERLAPAGVIHAVECGIGHEREYVRFWTRLGGR